MANICIFNLKAVGTKKNLEKFYKEVHADYDSNNNVCVYEGEVVARMGYRMQFDRYFDECYEDNTIETFGDCAWSVSNCMLENHGELYGNLRDWTKRLKIKIEAYSEEAGVGFAEHYLYDSGNCIIREVVDFEEFYIAEFDSKEQAEEELEVTFTDEEWESSDGDYIRRGGFGEYEWSI